MTWFRAFREQYGFTFYGEFRTSAGVDTALAAVIYICALISIATLVAALGIRGKDRWVTLIRVIYSMSIGSTIILTTYGYCWQEADVSIRSPYIYRSPEVIHGKIGIMMGLHKVNITLKGQFGGAETEVKYNEKINFDGFFVPQQELSRFLKRGLPDPVIAVVEYFTMDAEGLRWGRGFTTSGYFAYVLLWTSFAFWLLSNVMLSSVVFYGAAMHTLTGCTMILAAIVYHSLQPSGQIRMLHSSSDVIISYGICFWAVLAVGIFTTVVGLAIIVLDNFYPTKLAKHLLFEPPANDEDFEPFGDQKKIGSFADLQQRVETKRRSSLIPSNAFQRGFPASSSWHQGTKKDGPDTDPITRRASVDLCDTFKRNPLFANENGETHSYPPSPLISKFQTNSENVMNAQKFQNSPKSQKEHTCLQNKRNPVPAFQIGGENLVIENETTNNASTRTLESIAESETLHDNVGHVIERTSCPAGFTQHM